MMEQKNLFVIKAIFFALLFGIVILPLAILVIQSFAFSWRWGEVLPSEYSLRGWQVLLQEPKLVSAILMTVAVGFMVVVINLLIAIPSGKALALQSFKGKTLIDTILFMPILIPTLGIAMGVHMTFIRLGIADTIIGVVLVHLIPTVPYSIRLLRGGYERVGNKWLEQAKTLGASPWKSFFTVSLPLLLPSIRTAIFLVFLISLSQYVITLIIGGGTVITLAMLYYPFFYSVDYAVIASFSVLFAVIPIVFLALVEVCLLLFVPYYKRSIMATDKLPKVLHLVKEEK